MLPLPVVSIVTSCTFSSPSFQWSAVLVSAGVSPLHCLTCSCASFSFVFVLSTWIGSGPQAPSSIPLAVSQKSPLKPNQQSTGLAKHEQYFLTPPTHKQQSTYKNKLTVCMNHQAYSYMPGHLAASLRHLHKGTKQLYW